jgi:hypothetical protein
MKRLLIVSVLLGLIAVFAVIATASDGPTTTFH